MQHDLGLFGTWDEVMDALLSYSVGHPASIVGGVTDSLDDVGFWVVAVAGQWPRLLE